MSLLNKGFVKSFFMHIIKRCMHNGCENLTKMQMLHLVSLRNVNAEVNN